MFLSPQSHIRCVHNVTNIFSEKRDLKYTCECIRFLVYQIYTFMCNLSFNLPSSQKTFFNWYYSKVEKFVFCPFRVHWSLKLYLKKLALDHWVVWKDSLQHAQNVTLHSEQKWIGWKMTALLIQVVFLLISKCHIFIFFSVWLESILSPP